MYFKKYKSICNSLRGRRGTSSVTSNFTKLYKYKFFKFKVLPKHKFTKHNRLVFNISNLNDMFGSSILIKWLKSSYTNCFIGFYEYYNGSILSKFLNYGFSYTAINVSNELMHINTYEVLKDNYFIYNNLFTISIAVLDNYMKFFFLRTNWFGIISKSAGTYCTILDKNNIRFYILIKLPSNKQLVVDYTSYASYGRSANIFSKHTVFSSFFNKFKVKKKFQTNRGITKNPIDHPNGGSSKIKQPMRNPWGLIAKKNK